MQTVPGTCYLWRARTGVMDMCIGGGLFNLAKAGKRVDVKSKVANWRDAKFISLLLCALHVDASFRSKEYA